jgi:hypothetical protein
MSTNPFCDTIFDEAKEIIHGDREELYGHPSKNLERIATQWSLYMRQKYNQQVLLSAEDVCWMMSVLKMVRQMNADKRDNLVDAIGYIGLIERLNENES